MKDSDWEAQAVSGDKRPALKAKEVEEVEECLKCQMCLFPSGVFSVHEKYCFAAVNGIYL
jgi:hypothetical protein